MAEPTIQLGGGNWAGKSDNLLGYYKEGERFYKQDFTFSRSTTGTYTDSEGYIQEMPYNLLQQSNDFDTTWTLSAGVDLTSGQSGYDGTNNAWLLKRNTTGARYVQQTLTRPSGQYSYSVYLKAESTDWSYIWAYDGSTTVNAYFDLSNGVVGNTSGLDSTNVVSVGNGWYRCTITFTQAITSVRIYPAYANGIISTGTDNGIYIQDAQLVKGTSAKTYFPTTTRLNMPRVDYLNNSNGSLILESQRTNLVTYSEDFSQSVWGTWQTTKTQSNNINPKGTNGYYEISHTGSSSNNPNTRLLNVSLNGSYTLSFFVKINQSRYISLSIEDYDGDRAKVYFDTINKTFTTISNVGSPITNTAYSEFSNDWIRISLSVNLLNAVYNEVGVGIYNPSGSFPSSSGEVISVFGAQLEQGSHATTLINTQGSSVTRNADVCTNGGDASRFNDSEGVLFAEVSTFADNTYKRISINNGSYVNSILFDFVDNNNLYGKVFVGGSPIATILASGLNIENNNKIALKYKANDFALWVNGVEVGVDTTGSTPTGLNTLGFDLAGNQDFYGNVKQLQYFDTALSDTELEALTS